MILAETKWPNILRVVLIPLDKITVINPRTRNRKTFETIVRNIGQIGLKRPITVMPNGAARSTSSTWCAAKSAPSTSMKQIDRFT